MSDRDLLSRTLEHALRYVDGVTTRAVRPDATLAELRAALHLPLPDGPGDETQVIDELVAAVEPGLLHTSGGRFYGWVIGGVLPAALAADWLTSTWDQNGAIVATSPAAAVVEEVAGAWLLDVLGLPTTASTAFVTGSQMAHVTALAAARHRLLATRGWDVGRRGLAGAPPLRILASELCHESVPRAVRLLGIGTDAVVHVATDHGGRQRLDELGAALDARPDEPTIVCLQAGELHTGAFDPFDAACALAHARGAWVHVDGAFGLWAAASPRHRHLVAGVQLADSWVTDGHKWLNVPYDSGYAFVGDREAHHAAMTITASYFDLDATGRDQMHWNPEWSRRARGFTTFAALRSLGRRGLAELVDRCCEHATRIVEGAGALPGARVVARPVLNQGLVSFGQGGSLTDDVVARVREDGEAWFGATSYRGERAMRVSVSSWRTTAEDADRAVGAVQRALAAVA